MQFFKKWPGLFKGIGLMMVLFIPWDIWFTDIGVWAFNDNYTSGFRIFLLPIEEWLFFILVPYACLFIHSSLKYYLKKDFLKSISDYVYWVIFLVLVSLSIFYFEKTYTLVVSSLTAIALLYILLRKPAWRSQFLLTYLVCWIPFLLVNGALTGYFTLEPVVSYNPEEFMGIRMGSIPVEDSIYNLLMLLIVTFLYEKG